MNNTYLLLIINIITFILGYILGYLLHQNNQNYNQSGYLSSIVNIQNNRKQVEKNKVIEKIKSIDIDDSKVIIDADLSGMEKKFDSITETKHINENITASINKLSQMKGK